MLIALEHGVDNFTNYFPSNKFPNQYKFLNQLVVDYYGFWGKGKIKVFNKNKFYEQQNLQIDSSKAKKLLNWNTSYSTKKTVEVTTE